MGIGGSIALLVVGAILAFAVRDTDLGGVVDLNVVGWVLILAGLVGLVLTLWVWNSRRQRVVVAPPAAPAAPAPPATDAAYGAPDRRIVEERHIPGERRY